MKEKLFLRVSKVVARRLTETFDFVWPTAVAIWNLRWQVAGYEAALEHPATVAELSGRFISGSGIVGANLRRACLETSWEDQQQKFARFLLIEFCALYEAWCSGALAELGQSLSSKDLQYPTTFKTAGVPQKGVGHALLIINSPSSPVMAGALYPALTTNKKYSKSHLEELLTCYRYFKEARNAIVHGGVVTRLFLDAERDYSLLTNATLGVAEVPESATRNPDNTLSLSLRGVVGFGEVVLRLVCTLDAELSISPAAEAIFVRLWKEKHGTVSVSSNVHRRIQQINGLVRQMDMPKPSINPQFEAWLRMKSLIA
jgi:hypothetical protein